MWMNRCPSKACLENKSEIWTTLQHTSLSSAISIFQQVMSKAWTPPSCLQLVSRTCPYLYLIALSTMSGNFTIVITETRRPGTGSTKNSMNLYRTSGIVVMTIAEIQSPMIRITISNLLGGFDLVVIRLYIQIIFFGTIGISTRTLISRIFTLHLCP